MDLSNYVMVGRYDLPEPTRTTAPSGNLLGQEASGVTYNWDTNTLFIIGDGGTSVTQVDLEGNLIDTMTLASGSSAQGTEFYDTESITYVGNGKFVFTEERDRQIVQFTYAAGTTLTRANAQTVDLGTNIGNVGLEGISYDPLTGGFLLVKEKDPLGLFQTTVDFATGTASNGSSTTVNSTNLFDPALVGTTDLSDVYALSSNPVLSTGVDGDHILVLSQESGKIVELDRSGNIISTLNLTAPATTSGIDLAAMTVEGLTVGPDGTLYIVNEEGGGDFDHPQLWVFKPLSEVNSAPTAVTLSGEVSSILENSSTASRIKVASVSVTDPDGFGTNALSLSGADAASFEVDATGLYLKAGVTLDAETKASYEVTVNVDDASEGATPDASTNFALSVTNIVNEGADGSLAITEVAPWSSGDSPVAADWFELTNTGSTAISLSGWKMDDGSYSFASAVAMSGISTIAAGESVIFIEAPTAATPTQISALVSSFVNVWFGGTAPAGLQIGTYGGSGVGFGTSGDAVNVFDSTGTLRASVSFGASTVDRTFDNSAQLNSTSLTTHVAISTLSTAGTNGAFISASGEETGSPGSANGVPAPVNQAPTALSLTGEITSLGDNADTTSAIKLATIAVTDDGLGTNTLYLSGTDAAVFEIVGNGLYLKAGTSLDALTKSHYDVVVNVDDTTVGATPDRTVSFALDLTHVEPLEVRITEVAPWSSGNSPVGADWFEVTNTGEATIDLSGWKMDDGSNSFGSAVELIGVGSLAAGESAIFVEGSAATVTSFIDIWFGGVAPDGFKIGYYSGSGVGMSTGGDGVNLFDSGGAHMAGVSFGASPVAAPFATFDNAEGLDGVTLTTLSAVAVNGAFTAAVDANEIGSPGAIAETGTLYISEVAPWSSGNSPVGADWFEITNTTHNAIDISGWKMDDGSASFATAFALNGVTSIGVGESVVFVEGTAATAAALISTWFGGNPPAGLKVGYYSGSGLGMSTGGDGVTLFNAAGVEQARVTFGASPTGPDFATFINTSGAVTAALTDLSVAGVDDAFTAVNDSHEIGSPGDLQPLANSAPVFTSPNAFSADENQGLAAQLTATDIDGDAFTFSIAGGLDGALFAIDANTGAISFIASPDYESPADSNGDNVYEIDVAVDDGQGHVGEASITVAVTDVAEPGQVISGTRRVDILTGGNGDDVINGEGNDDVVSGGDGNDSLLGGTGNDQIAGGRGSDLLSGDAGKDNLSGDVGQDILFGGGGVDMVDGGDDNDQLFGGDSSDTLHGSAGDDILEGGDGMDYLTGGIGSDSFVFVSAMTGGDHIVDFETGIDHIQLDATALGLAAGPLDPAMLEYGSKAADAGATFVYDSATGKLWFDDDGKGGHGAKLIAVLDNHAAITSADFILV